jgi:16S rRNA (cytosine1402-N4)-methyltransferase
MPRPEKKQEGHQSVLLHEAVSMLDLRTADIVVDATLGGAGHAREIANQLASDGVLIGVDADGEAIKRAALLLARSAPAIHLVHANFRAIAAELSKIGITRITKAIFDLGWSSYQLDSGRGFSFRADEPLLMTYDEGQALTASTIVNDWEESSIADVIYGFGEEHFSRRIARAIVEARAHKRIERSLELAEIIRAAVPAAYRRGRLHPATKTFQALRIAVNDELGALEAGLANAWDLLAPGGRIAVITFHSIEDRIVKRRFASWEKDGVGTRVNKKAIGPSDEEIAANPRSRSAKLRVIQKIDFLW